MVNETKQQKKKSAWHRQRKNNVIFLLVFKQYYYNVDLIIKWKVQEILLNTKINTLCCCASSGRQFYMSIPRRKMFQSGDWLNIVCKIYNCRKYIRRVPIDICPYTSAYCVPTRGPDRKNFFVTNFVDYAFYTLSQKFRYYSEKYKLKWRLVIVIFNNISQ